jgi:hypothetical protein
MAWRHAPFDKKKCGAMYCRCALSIDECWLKIDTLLPSSTSPFFFSFCRQSAFLKIFTMASKFYSSLELSPFDQAILRIVWRNEKGHIGNTWRHIFFYQKGHDAMPFYFSLDKTLL